MRVLINPFFGLLLFSGMSIYTLQKYKVELPSFIQNYANDFLIMPLVLWIVLAVLTELKGRNARVTWLMTISLVIYYSLFFEYYLPQSNQRYTADLYDVYCYFAGASLFMLFQNTIKRHQL